MPSPMPNTSRSRPLPRPQAGAPCSLLFLLILGWLLVSAGRGHAQPACDDGAKLPNPVYLSVGDTQVNLMKELGAKLRQHGDHAGLSRHRLVHQPRCALWRPADDRQPGVHPGRL